MKLTTHEKFLLALVAAVLLVAGGMALYCGGRRAVERKQIERMTEQQIESAHETAKEKRDETSRVARSGDAERMWKHLLERARQRP